MKYRFDLTADSGPSRGQAGDALMAATHASFAGIEAGSRASLPLIEIAAPIAVSKGQLGAWHTTG